jgi:dTDP-4-amino-4,6-dideoxygalactose transaminase
MHATKAFATAEGGLVYCADRQIVAEIRAMGNFGFGEPRAATMPGLNSKMSEVCALLGLAKLGDYETVARHRQAIFDYYRASLPEFTFQKLTGQRMAHQFVSVLVPESHSGRVDEVIEAMRARCRYGPLLRAPSRGTALLSANLHSRRAAGYAKDCSSNHCATGFRHVDGKRR